MMIRCLEGIIQKILKYVLGCLIALLILYSGNLLADIAQSQPIQQTLKVYARSFANNKHEARIIAQHVGMHKVLLLLADKIGIKGAATKTNLEKLPLAEMKKAFSIIKTTDENNADNSYSAFMEIAYDEAEVNKILISCTDDDIKKQFYDFLVIPIFKKNSVLKIWPNSHYFLNYFANIDFPTFYPNLIQADQVLLNKMQNFVNTKGLDNLSYKAVISNANFKLFKKVVFLIFEYHTDLNNQEPLIEVTNLIIGADEAVEIKNEIFEVNVTESQLSQDKSSLAEIIRVMLDNLTRKKSRAFESSKGVFGFENSKYQKTSFIISNANLTHNQRGSKEYLKEYKAIADLIFSKKKLLISKNHKIKDIYLKKGEQDLYILEIDHKMSQLELTEVLYEHGLSYRESENNKTIFLLSNNHKH